MWRANIKNRAFDRMGEEWAPLIDPNHFLGRNAFDIPHPKSKQGPPATLVREGDLLVLEIDVADFNQEELMVEVKNNLLFVSGKREENLDLEGTGYVSQEMHRDSFERLFKLAPSIAREGVSAQLKEGVLRIKFVDVPEEEEDSTYRKVEIR